MKEQLQKFLDTYDYPEDAKAWFARALDAVLALPEGRELLDRHLIPYRDEGKLDYPAMLADARSLVDATGFPFVTLEFLFAILLAPYSKPFYEKAGVPEQVYFDSMCDFKWKNEECKRVYGVYGSFHAFWFDRWFFATRFAFGRLQFEPDVAKEDFDFPGGSVRKGDRVINVHIPSDPRTKITKENCDAAYAAAREYFKPLFGDKPVVFRCSSWLLFPGNLEILPESSNIRRFCSEYYLMPGFHESTNDIWRLFHVEYHGDPATLPEDTSVQRIYKQYMLDGGKVGSAVGYRL